MIKSLNLACLIAAVVLVPTSAGAAAITNGSFETGSFVADSSDADALPSGSTAINGWTVTGGPSPPSGALAWIGSSNTFGLSASQGSFFLDLTGYNDGSSPFGGVSQAIATTVGQKYLLTFDLGSSNLYGIPDGVAVYAGSVLTNVLFTSTNTTSPNFWQAESITFTANSPITTLLFQGNQGTKYIGLDNVAIADVPEPLTLSLFGIGLAGAAGIRRRRKLS